MLADLCKLKGQKFQLIKPEPETKQTAINLPEPSLPVMEIDRMDGGVLIRIKEKRFTSIETIHSTIFHFNAGVTMGQGVETNFRFAEP